MSDNGQSVPSNRVAQASGMVAAHVGCSVQAAMLLMTQRADETNVTLDAVAAAVVARETMFA